MPPVTPLPAEAASEPGRARAWMRVTARSRSGAAHDPGAWLIAAATFAAYTAISLARYARLDPGSWDLGIYTEYVKHLAHLQAPVVAIRGQGFNLLGDHFQPIVGLLAPLFRLFPTPVTLLAAQAALTAVSVVPVCRAARELLGTGISRTVGAAYGFSWGLQQMVNFDFHEVAFAVPLLAFTLSALVRGRPRAAALWALPLVFVKEDQGFTVAAIGGIMLWYAIRGAPGRKKQRGHGEGTAGGGSAAVRARGWAWPGGALVIWGLAWSALAIMVVIPHFNPAHHYQYWHDGGALRPGAHPSLAAALAQLRASAPEKLRTVVMILVPTGFLAAWSPLALAAVPGLALRFLSTNSYFWGTSFHYDAAVMPVVFLAAVDVLGRVQARRRAPHGRPVPRARHAAGRRGSRARAGDAAGLPSAGSGERLAGRRLSPRRAAAAVTVPRAAAAVMVTVAAVLAFRFPLAQVWQPSTYTVTAHVRAEYAAMARVPPGVTVASTLSMLAPFAARDVTFWSGSSGGISVRYVVFDARDNQWYPRPDDIAAFVARRHPGSTYRMIYEAGNVYVFRSTARTGG